jgi:copper(I)-binding protein
VIRSGWGSALPRRLVLVAVALLIPILAGCEADNDAPSLQFHYPTDTAGYPADSAGSSAMGNLAIRNVFVLGAPLGQSLQKGQSASLFLALVNDGAPDKLISISAPGSATAVSLPAGGVSVVDGHPVFLTGPKPQLVLLGLTRPLTSGSSLRLTLTFQKAGTITLLVPVMPRAVQYQTYAPPQPTQTAASPSPSSTAKPSPTPST